mgnify:CR=1 FL=1
MPVNISSVGEVLTVYLEGELDHHAAKTVREEIDEAVEFNMPTLLILDFDRVTFMDSSGIGVIIGRYKKMNYVGGAVYVCGMNKNVDRIFQMSGLYKLVKQLNKAEVV